MTNPPTPTMDRPMTPLLPDRETALWMQIDLLFQKHGLPHPPYRLRDELVTHLAWAHYGHDAARSVGGDVFELREAVDDHHLLPGHPIRDEHDRLAALSRIEAGGGALQPQAASVSTEGPDTAVLWAVGRWKAEVENRPLVNKNRRALDDTWRQVIRHFGGDPGLLLPLPNHDTMVAASQPGIGAADEPKAPAKSSSSSDGGGRG